MNAKGTGMRVVRAALLGCLLSACSSGGSESATQVEIAAGNLGPTQRFPEDNEVCPSTVESAPGAACDVEGEVCYPQYPCGIAPGQATCTCTAGHFACVDQLGTSLHPDGAAPGCPATLATPACPASMTQANLTACSQAGEICTYPSPCTSIPEFIDCQCVPLTQIDGGVYLGYTCDDLCTPGSSAAPVEAGTTPPVEAGATTPVDASVSTSGPHDAAADGKLEAGPTDATAD
jgi:hypothetical protein